MQDVVGRKLRCNNEIQWAIKRTGFYSTRVQFFPQTQSSLTDSQPWLLRLQLCLPCAKNLGERILMKHGTFGTTKITAGEDNPKKPHPKRPDFLFHEVRF